MRKLLKPGVKGREIYLKAVGKPPSKSVCLEAEEITHGARQSSYGHPFDNFSRVAKMLNGQFGHLLRPGLEFQAEDVGFIQIILKLGRSAHSLKRDNLVDIAGYANTIEMVMERRAGR